MNTTYPIIANCNFATRDDEIGQAVNEAHVAAEKGWTDDGDLAEALDVLEMVLTDAGDKCDVETGRITASAERDVVEAWTDEVQTAATAERESRYVD